MSMISTFWFISQGSTASECYLDKVSVDEWYLDEGRWSQPKGLNKLTAEYVQESYKYKPQANSIHEEAARRAEVDTE